MPTNIIGNNPTFKTQTSALTRSLEDNPECSSPSAKISLGFLLAARMLTSPAMTSLERIWILKNLNAIGVAKVDPEYHPIEKVLTHISDTVTRCIFTSRRGTALVSAPHPYEVSNTYAAAYKGLGVLYHLLKHYIYRQQQQQQQQPLQAITTAVDTQAGFIYPPNITTIPFLSFMNVPAPFSSPHAAELFSLCHVESMCTIDFLTTGPWVGYYSYSYQFDPLHPHHRGRILFDPPMRNINFFTEGIRAASPTEPETIYIGATDCIDHCGTFNLVGEVTTDVGRVTMRKEYVAAGARGSIWQWNALLTPFGIVGSWDRSGRAGEGWGGWFWLWKSEWSGSKEGWFG